jgi:protein TonB
VLALAVLGLLVAAAATSVSSPADTVQRIPGTTLRFGTPVATATARGFPAAPGGAHTGPCRFFGLESDATLTFEAGRLVRAEFATAQAAPHQISYVEDQLRRMGYKRRCQRATAQASTCDWTGAARVHLEVSGSSLTATVEPAGATGAAIASASPAAPPSAASRALARLTGAPARGDTMQAPATAAPVGADSAQSAGAAAPGSTGPDEAAIAMLPETLAVHLPNRPSHFASASVLREEPPRYPEAALKAGVQGRVWLLALVDTSGTVLEAHIEHGIAELDQAAIEAVRRWRFESRSWQGSPCRYWVEVPVLFRLH